VQYPLEMDSGADDALVVRVSPRWSRSEGARADRSQDPRARRTRAAVVQAATALFLDGGYQGTNTEDIASAAGVSKRTLYNNFGDKETLFTEIVLGITDAAARFADDLVPRLHAADDVPDTLRDLARRLLRDVTRPQVLQLRRLLISEAGRFPELAREYHRRAPGRVLTALTTAFAELAARGAVTVPDPRLAAEHFAFLVLGATLDRAMFEPAQSPPSDAERDRAADAGVRVFLAAYGDARS
jgi:TetR/AcrR family transcriptional regulator, mexJK operon transcriptional repressor